MNEEEILNLARAGIFESLRSFEGKIFRLKEHIDRLFASAKTVGIKIIPSPAELKKQLEDALKKTGLKNAYLRLSLSRQGEASIIVKKLTIYPKRYYEKGIRLKTVPTRKPGPNTLAGLAKSSDFLGGVFAKMESPGAEEGLLLAADGLVGEATVSNIFLVKNRTLISPPAYLGILAGITRRVVIELAAKLSIDFSEEPITRHNLYNAEEAFLTNTSMGIMPVSEIDGRKLGLAGKITRRLQSEFRKLTKREGKR